MRIHTNNDGSGWPKQTDGSGSRTPCGAMLKWQKPMLEECSSPRRKASTSLAKKSCPNWSVRRRKVAVSWPARYTSRAGTPDTSNKSCESGSWTGTYWLQIQPLRKERNSKTIFLRIPILRHSGRAVCLYCSAPKTQLRQYNWGISSSHPTSRILLPNRS
jgi:hypothetical protein